MAQMDIVHHSRDVRQEHEGAGHVFPQSGSRPMTASTPIIFLSFLFFSPSSEPQLWDGATHMQTVSVLLNHCCLELLSQMCLLDDSKSSHISGENEMSRVEETDH